MADEGEEPRRVLEYPQDSNSYEILDEIGIGESTITYKAKCIPMNSASVAIKSIDLDRCEANIDDVRREAETASLLSHPNILSINCSFIVDQSFWIIMPFMSAGSLQSIVSYFPEALSEQCMPIILRETLTALIYLHEQGHVYKDINAGNIFISCDGSVKLAADFGISSLISESKSSPTASSSSSLMLKDDGYWVAPEVIQSNNGNGYSFKADIWSFGITALELAQGRPPISQLPASKSLIKKINKRFWLSDHENKEKEEHKEFCKDFKDMITSCLDQDPSKRPSAEEVLNQPFFKNCEVWDSFVAKNLFQELPSVEESFKETKSLRLRSLSNNFETDEEDDEGYSESQNECYMWKFNEERFELEFQNVNTVPIFELGDSDESGELDLNTGSFSGGDEEEGEESGDGGGDGISGGGSGGSGDQSLRERYEMVTTGLQLLNQNLREQAQIFANLVVQFLQDLQEFGGENIDFAGTALRGLELRDIVEMQLQHVENFIGLIGQEESGEVVAETGVAEAVVETNGRSEMERVLERQSKRISEMERELENARDRNRQLTREMAAAVVMATVATAVMAVVVVLMD